MAYFARAKWPRTELFALLVASILPDLADFVLPQGNQCRTRCGMFTHAFPAFLVLAIAAGVLAWFIWHRRATAWLVFAMVLVHIALDVITGYKPFWYGGPELGLGMYNFPLVDLAIEVPLAVAGWWTLRRTAAPPRFATRVGVLVALILVQAGFDLWLLHLKSM